MQNVIDQRITNSAQGERHSAHTPPPLRLPKALLQHLAKPFESVEDVDRLIAHIRICEWRGLL